jgi:hypothetical protein
MKAVRGQVISNVDSSMEAEFWAMFPEVGADAYKVTYTSPFFKVNSGGILGIPSKGDQILAFWNESAGRDESEFYYISTIVSKEDLEEEDQDTKFNVLPENDLPAYNSQGQPTMQYFTNTAGAGLYIHRDHSANKIDNNVILKAEGGEEVTVCPLGVQIRNADGDSVVLNGSEPNEAYGARSFAIETQGSHEYKCIAGDINMRVIDGGDINIENNSWGLYGLPPWFGNVRVKSRWKDVTLAALGLVSRIHIVTNTGKITINGATGEIELFTPTNISLNAGGAITLNAGASISLNAGGIASVNAQGAASINSNAAVSVNSNGLTSITGQAVDVNSIGSTSVNSGGSTSVNGGVLTLNTIPYLFHPTGPTGGSSAAPNAPVPATPINVSLPAIPTPPVIVPPIPNDYADGVPGADGGGAV